MTISAGNAVWATRVLGLLLGITGWWSFDQALDGRSSTAGTVVAVVVGAAFAVVIVALVVPSTASLTALRLLTPLSVVAAICSLAAGAGAAAGTAFLAIAAVDALLVLGGDVGEANAQASAYGDESRYPLRAPAAYIVPVVLSWCIWCATVIAAALLLGGSSWLLGGLLLLVAVGVTWLVVPRYHRLSRRWLVVVPAGLVVHDHLVLAETMLVQRAEITNVQLALADTEAADITGPAAGHALDVAVRDTIKISFAGTRAQPDGRGIHARSFLVAPTRPGRALRQVAARKLPVA